MEAVVSTMVDEKLSRIRSRTSNIRRYRRLLKTDLTELERGYILRRLSEEERALTELMSETFPLCVGSSSTGSSQAREVGV